MEVMLKSVTLTLSEDQQVLWFVSYQLSLHTRLVNIIGAHFGSVWYQLLCTSNRLDVLCNKEPGMYVLQALRPASHGSHVSGTNLLW